MTTTNEFPAFAFARRRDIELGAGFILAGQLILDERKPAADDLPDGLQQTAASIIKELTMMARSGRMPDDTIAFGWRGGRKPANAVDTDNHALLEAWAKDRFTIALRVDARSNGRIRVDSDVMRQIGSY